MPDEPGIVGGHIRDFTPDPRNARKHTPRNVGMIERSLSEAGAGRSIVVSGDGTVLAGNATLEAAAAAGFEEAIVVRTDGKKLLVHVREDLEAGSPQATKLALYDNRSAELAEWDADVLRDLAADELLRPLFTDKELDKLLSGEADAPALDASPQLSGVVYRVVVDVPGEHEQAALLSELEGRGFTARALIS